MMYHLEEHFFVCVSEKMGEGKSEYLIRMGCEFCHCTFCSKKTGNLKVSSCRDRRGPRLKIDEDSGCSVVQPPEINNKKIKYSEETCGAQILCHLKPTCNFLSNKKQKIYQQWHFCIIRDHL